MHTSRFVTWKKKPLLSVIWSASNVTSIDYLCISNFIVSSDSGRWKPLKWMSTYSEHYCTPGFYSFIIVIFILTSRVVLITACDKLWYILCGLDMHMDLLLLLASCYQLGITSYWQLIVECWDKFFILLYYITNHVAPDMGETVTNSMGHNILVISLCLFFRGDWNINIVTGSSNPCCIFCVG